MGDELSGNLTESTGQEPRPSTDEERAAAGGALTSATESPAETAGEVEPLPPPWTHIYKGLGARVLERKDDESRGPVVVIECDDRSTRTLNQSNWDENAEPIDQGTGDAEKQQEPTAAPPWTHHLDGCKARLLSPRGEPGDELHIEVLVPEGEPAPGVEPRTMLQSVWDARAEEIPAQPEVLPGDQAPSSGGRSEPAEVAVNAEETAEAEGPSEPTLTQLAGLVGVELEELPDESFIVRGRDLPKGGLFVEPDKIRAILEGIRDGTWRDA